MTEKSTKPQLRFAGFDDTWEQRKVSELFRVTRGYVLATTQTDTTKTDEKPYPVYSSQTKDKGLMGYYKDYLYEDAITWTTDGANAGTVNYRAGKFYCTNVCGVLLSNEVKANQMIAEALNNVAKGYVSYVGNPKLMNNVMADIVIQIPTQSEERELLSSLFASFDNLITLHQRKYDKLTNVKKSMLEKMFPKNGSNVPEIRFKGFSDAWEQRKLSSLCVKFTDGDWIEAKDQSNSGVRLIQTGNVGVAEYLDKPNNKKWVSEDTFEALHCEEVFGGDILISRLPEPAGRACIVPNLGTKMITAVDCTIVRVSENINNEFLLQYLSSQKYFDEVNTCLAGGTRQRISRSNLADFDIMLPTKKQEQQQIGAFFRNLDNLITLHQRELEKLKNLKKTCLEKMFV